MAEVRLSKLMKQFNVGLARLASFLNDAGCPVEENPPRSPLNLSHPGFAELLSYIEENF